jgi:hypothetical protein
MPSSGMVRRVALVRTDGPPKRRVVQEPHSVIPEDGILNSHHSESLLS